MCDVLLMAVINGFQDLCENSGCILFVEKLLLDNFVEQLAPFTELCDQVNVLLILEILVKFKYMRMVKCPEDIDFLLESLLILNLFPGDYLACSFLSSLDVFHFTDHSESS